MIARQELHTEVQTQRVIDKLDEIQGQLDHIISNQITIISQNKQIIAAMSRIENNRLAQLERLRMLNIQTADIQYATNSINQQVSKALGNTYSNIVSDAFHTVSQSRL